MKFTKEFLQEMDYKEMLNEITGTSRWSTFHRVVFEHDGKFYETEYSIGSTECQDETPYEYEDDIIECPEVELVEEKVMVWRQKK